MQKSTFLKMVILLILITFSIPILADNSLQGKMKYTIFGRITEAANGETLEGANVEIKDLELGTTTNNYGFYSLSVPPGKYIVSYSRMGFKTITTEIILTDSKSKNIELHVQPINLQGISVSAEEKAEIDNIELPEMGTIKISPMEIKTVPILLGEQDLLKTYQLMPGVKPAGEGNSGYYVRGGNTDENLILLDEAPVYYASHLMGFFSVFNSDAIKDVKLYKGSAPAEYGGRLSSIMDIKMKDGNVKKYSLSGGIGLIASRLTLEGPLGSEKGSLLISGRRTYADLFLPLSSDESVQDMQLYFYDFNTKANYRFGEKNHVYLSGYIGQDVLGLGENRGMNWGNTTMTLRWNHLFSNKLFSNTSVIYSNYGYQISMGNTSIIPQIDSGITDINFKEDINYYANPYYTMKFGFNVIHHNIDPGKVNEDDETSTNSTQLEYKNALENAIYISNEWIASERFTLDFGLRLTAFTTFGQASVNSYNEAGEVISTTSYDDGEIIKNYTNLEPRFTANYRYNEKSSYKCSYSRNVQYLHRISTSSAGLPMDIWIPSSEIVKPRIADQISLGYFRNFDENRYEASVEVYYKNMQNQIDYKDNADVLMNADVEAELVFGDAWAYGIEFFLKKRFGRLNGWVGYTLSTSKRRYDEINAGETFPAKQDRTHDISLVINYELNDKWTLSSSWVYYTGDAVTFPIGKYQIEGQTVNLYGNRNSDRMPDYHRLDLGATYQINDRSSLNFSVYNAYYNMNAYTITFQENEDDPTVTEAVKLTLFPIIPSITYNFKF